MTQNNTLQNNQGVDQVQKEQEPVNHGTPSLAAASSPAFYNANFTDLPIDMASLLRALWRRKWFVLTCCLVFTALAVYSAYTATPVYESKAVLELKALPALPKSELHSETSMSKVDEKKYMEAMKRLLGSRRLALMVIRHLELHKTALWLATDDENEPAQVSEEDRIKSCVNDFQSVLSVSIEKGGVTGVINLSYLDKAPKRADDILTALIDQFWLILYERPEIAFAKERNHIKQMIDQAQKKLDSAYDALNTFLSENDIFFLENVDVMTKKDIEITSSQLLELSKKAEHASHERIQAEVVLNQAGKDPKGIREITDSPMIMTLKEELALAEAELANLSAIYAPRHSARQSVTAKVESLKQAIQNESNTIKETIRHNFETALSKETDLVTRVDKMKNYVIRKKALKGEYDAIEAEIEINRKVYQSVLQQYEALKIQTVFPFTLNMIDPPLVSDTPVKPDKGLRIAIGFIVGIIFGGSLALLIEFTNPGLRAPVEAERRTGLPMLGAVPPMRRRKELAGTNEYERFKHLGSWPEFNQSFNDAVGILLSRPGVSVSITSPGENEGKALTAIGISRQLMGAGKKVLLIDADFSTPRLDRVFDLEDSPGLLDILEKKVRKGTCDSALDQLKPVAESAGGGRLYSLKSGLSTKNATPLGLIEMPAFMELLEQCRSEADYVIVITPPLLREVATYIINRAVDTTLLVLRERQSMIKDAVRATEVMHRVGISILGLIVTESEYYNK